MQSCRCLIARLNGKRLLTGRVVDIERKTEGGFARGQATLNGMDEYEGQTFRVNFQNEFLIALNAADEPLAVTPDLICAVDADGGLPVTTEQLRFGLAVTMIGLPCDPQWRTQAGIDLVGPAYFGYPQAYTPLEELPL